MHLKPMKLDWADPLIAIAGGGSVNLFNSQGNLDCRLSEITGELDVDLRSNIAAEARAKIVYERLINSVTTRALRTRCSS